MTSPDFDDDVVDILGSNQEQNEANRARRRREEAVRRLVADIHRRANPDLLGGPVATSGPPAKPANPYESHEWLVASTVAAALERGLDKDLQHELVREAQENAARIGQVCHDHSDAFLTSVGRVVALGNPAAALQTSMEGANRALQETTAGQMLEAAALLEHAQQAHQRARTLAGMVTACRNVAVLLERARKQASLGRPRAALDAVDEARTCLTAPVSSLLLGTKMMARQQQQQDEDASGASSAVSLEETPFGRRAMVMLPKIENEVLMGARRGLNRWFLALRSGGDGAKSGRAVMRKCAGSMAIGPGRLGLGGHLPPSYIWRAKVADNLLSRIRQGGKVARAVRMGYWFERDAPKEAERLEGMAVPGMERRAEAFAMAFGWYRCWEENATLMVDITEMNLTTENQTLSGSRHGSRHGNKRGTLSFRGTKTGGMNKRDLGRNAGGKNEKQRPPWAELLTPPILFENVPTKKEEDEKLMGLAESVHPVRRAELAFNLLGRSEEFVQYYEQNRFGDMKIGGTTKDGKKDDDKNEVRSSLSSLTGDDVSVGTDRVFFAKSLPHLCASVVGFSAVEAALELGNFDDDDDDDNNDNNTKGGSSTSKNHTSSASRFRESSARYERSLVTELGHLLRGRAIGASLAELARSSCLISAFRSALKIVHPSSSTRRSDKELLAMDLDIVMTALKVAQDEQLKATKKIASEDKKEPVPVSPLDTSISTKGGKNTDGIPEEELVGYPFGLRQLKQKSGAVADPLARPSRSKEQFYTFSKSVPEILRSIHARAIACASFALSQEELGQMFNGKKGSGSADYVLDCVELCVKVAAIGMHDGAAILEEASVDKAVQTMANIAALQSSLPRLFGNIMRGMCHCGMIRVDQMEDTFQYAESMLKSADKHCDSEVGKMYSLVYEICRGKIDNHINFALDNFQWTSKGQRDVANPYCEGLIQYLRQVFSHLGPMDEGSRFGLHFSCCGHVAERMVKLLTDPVAEYQANPEDYGISPIVKIDALGLKNMALDVREFENFADATGVPQLSECFGELKCLVTAMLDRELPRLLRREHAAERRNKYPVLSMEKVGNILEKYVGMGLGDKLLGASHKRSDFLMMEKKEVQQLIKIVRSQDS